MKLLTNRQWPAWRRFRAAETPVPRPTTTAGRRLLLLTWEFPPQVTGGVYRPLSFARYAAASGWQAEVVCGPAPDPPSQAGRYLAGLLPVEVPVTRVAADTGPHPWPLPKIDGGIMNALSLFEAAAARIRPGEGGVILASGPPFASFVAAYWLARQTGWRLVLDYRDEWTQSPHGFNSCDEINRRWESRCLRTADRVMFTTQAQIDHQAHVFPELDRKKCLLIQNGWEPEDFLVDAVRPDGTVCQDSSRIEVAFFGNLGPWWHIDEFLSTLARLYESKKALAERVVISFTGNVSPQVTATLDRFAARFPLKRVDHVPKVEACQRMRKVEILLLPNPPSLSRYIPGKIYEYIAAGRPLLVYGEGGEMGAIVKQLDVGFVVPAGDVDALARAIIELPRHSLVNICARQEWLESRTRKVLARKMIEAMNELIA